MLVVNLLEAKSEFFKLIDAIEQGHFSSITIVRDGRPAAKLVAIDAPFTGKRIGVAAGKFTVPDDIDIGNDKIAQIFFESH